VPLGITRTREDTVIHTDGTPTIANATPLRGFSVRNEGSIFLVQPLDHHAKLWLAENVDNENAQYFGSALAVEHRYAYDLVDGIFDAGFAVR
jgi:hypothetical protein